MTGVAIYVELPAKPGREEEVARFPAGARDLVMAEAGTVAWFAAKAPEIRRPSVLADKLPG